MPTAEIIAIGTELLLGETLETNSRIIARALRELGINIYRITVIGDNTERITNAVREAAARADIIITTGGLGPTVDDPTRQAIAQSVGKELEFQDTLWKQIAARIARMGRTPDDNQKRQAYIPQGAVPIHNPVGTAPAFILETERGSLISLPGVPREMETILIESIVPYLRKRFHLKEMIKIRVLHASGAGEGWIDEQVGDLETLANPTVGLTAHAGIVDIRITVKAGSDRSANQLITKMEKEIRQRLGESVYGADEERLEQVALRVIEKSGWSFAALEIGLNGALLERLARAQSTAYVDGKCLQAKEARSLNEAVEEYRNQVRAEAVLGVSLQTETNGHTIELRLVTPESSKERHLTYLGHADNATAWAANMALDLLRRTDKAGLR